MLAVMVKYGQVGQVPGVWYVAEGQTCIEQEVGDSVHQMCFGSFSGKQTSSFAGRSRTGFLLGSRNSNPVVTVCHTPFGPETEIVV